MSTIQKEQPRTFSAGHYYRKQIGCENSVISWSHQSRFETALQLVGDGKGKKLLDYGSGDGTFLQMVSDRFDVAWGADITQFQVSDCQARLASYTNLHFCLVQELSDRHNGVYDVVTCMETLEHCIDAIADVVLRDLSRLCASNGQVIISVPIEIGPAFLLKYLVRNLAAWRGLSDYKHYERYSFGDILRMIFATSCTKIERPVYGGPEAPYHSHYGFNWRRMRSFVRRYLHIERTTFSPLAWSTGLVSSQAWFVCRPKRESSGQSIGHFPVGPTSPSR